MKKLVILGILFLLIVFVGCTEEKSKATPTPEESPMATPIIPPIPAIEDTIAECDSLCNNDADAYCEEVRMIMVDGEEVKGTCRAFSKKGAVEGFNRCQGFCKEFDRSGTQLS